MEKDSIRDTEAGDLVFEFSENAPAKPDSDDYIWTIKTVKLAERRPITQETVKELLRDKDLRDVARVAMKFVKKNGDGSSPATAG
jgi:hypothetical protein